MTTTLDAMDPTLDAPDRCSVCSSRALRTDAVWQSGWLLLGECEHCDHRFTRPLPMPSALSERETIRARPVGSGLPEVASAA